MNKSVIILFLLIPFALFAKDKTTPPAEVLNAFNKLYPNQKHPEWVKLNNTYKAHFNIKFILKTVTFNEKGILLETETEVDENDLPPAVLDAIGENFKNHKIKQAFHVKTDQELKYRIHVKRGKSNFFVVYDLNGKMLEKIDLSNKQTTITL